VTTTTEFIIDESTFGAFIDDEDPELVHLLIDGKWTGTAHWDGDELTELDVRYSPVEARHDDIVRRLEIGLSAPPIGSRWEIADDFGREMYELTRVLSERTAWPYQMVLRESHNGPAVGTVRLVSSTWFRKAREVTS
jgi:hypothetical protein